jgi:hypothetical protein
LCAQATPYQSRAAPLVALGTAASSSSLRPSPSWDHPQTCSLDRGRASRAACSFAPSSTSPEQEAQRLAPVAATARPHRHNPDPNQALKSSPDEPLNCSLAFPGQEPRRDRRILAETAAPMARGLNFVSLLLLGVFCVNRGYLCEESKLSGAWSQK